MYELRVLSGLHRGATLPLDDQPHVIGASEDADVVLVDSEVKEKHATLTRTDTGWLLAALDGSVCSADSNQPQSLIDLLPGDFVRLGGVWLTVVDQEARWENPPPEPVETHFDALSADADGPLPEDSTAMATEAAGTPESHDGNGDTARSAQAGQSAESHLRRPRAWQRLLRRRAVFIPLGATVLSAAAYGITAKPDVLTSRKLAEAALFEAKLRASANPGARAIGDAYVATHPAAEDGKPLTPEELRKAFRKRLADAYLLRRFDLSLQDNQWQMQAALDSEESARFERILTAFVKQHDIKFPVHVKVGDSEAMLPFKIRQVISGANASVVTQDGYRLYVGDQLRGVRLLAVNGNKLTFAGKRKFEVTW